MFYDKGSYATSGNFPSVEWIPINIVITIKFLDNILWLVDSWYFKLSIDHYLWTVRPVVDDLSMLKTKCWWIFKLWHSYLCQKTWEVLNTPFMSYGLQRRTLEVAVLFFKNWASITTCHQIERSNILLELYELYYFIILCLAMSSNFCTVGNLSKKCAKRDSNTDKILNEKFLRLLSRLFLECQEIKLQKFSKVYFKG